MVTGSPPSRGCFREGDDRFFVILSEAKNPRDPSRAALAQDDRRGMFPVIPTERKRAEESQGIESRRREAYGDWR